MTKDKVSEESGIFGSTTYMNATVTFSMPLISEVEVLMESWDYSSCYTMTLGDASDSIMFEMPDYPAHYTITTSFQGIDGIYDTTFVFHVGDTDRI